MTLPPVAPIPAQTRADHAIVTLRDIILSGAIAPGTPLREIQLSRELAISRGPLREALQRLEEEGLVQREPFRGSFVAEVSIARLTEIEHLRTVLEPYAAVSALSELQEGQAHDRLVEAVEALEAAANSGDSAASINAHLAVHHSIYTASNNKVLSDLWLSWQNQMRLFMAVDQRRLGDLVEIAAAHRALLTVIESGDVKAVRREFAAHIRPEAVAEDFGTN